MLNEGNIVVIQYDVSSGVNQVIPKQALVKIQILNEAPALQLPCLHVTT
jgi:hypothetical protein